MPSRAARWGAAAATALLGGVIALLLGVTIFVTIVNNSQAACGIGGSGAGPVGGVPAADIPIFQGAAAKFGLGDRGPSILAAVNQVESDFGMSNQAGVHSGANGAGAEGPMQFLPATFATYAANAPGNPPPPQIYNEADAVYSAANYLHASGAPGDWSTAIFAYNHASWYVNEVLSKAQGYYSQGLSAQGSSGAAGATPGAGSSSASSTGQPFAVPPASGDPAGPMALAQGRPTIVAATYFTDQTGAWGENLSVNSNSYAELSPGLVGAQVTKANANMLGGLPHLAPLRVTNPANGKSVVLYKRDIGGGQPLSSTIKGYHYRIDLTGAAEQQLGLSGSSLVQVTLLNGPVNTPGSGASCTTSGASGAIAGTPGPGGYYFPIQPESLAVGPGSWTLDAGVDIATNGGACAPNAKEVALGSGTIIGEGLQGFGNYAPVLKLDSGSLAGQTVYYGHAAPDAPGISVGTHVQAGQVIAYVGCGDVGLSTGPHIEFGLYANGSFPGNQQTSPQVKALLLQLYHP